MPTARERQVCQKKHCHRKSVSDDGQNTSAENIVEIGCDCCSDDETVIESVAVPRNPPPECSAAIQCTFCRWKRLRRSVLEGGVVCDRGEGNVSQDPAGLPPGMDSEEQWCGRLIRDQHGLYGKLTPVFREHFSNRRKNSQDSTTAIFDSDSVFAGDARQVAMETAEGEQQRSAVLAAQLSGMSLAERRLAVAPRITLTSVDGEDEAGARQQQRSSGSDGDGMPCRSAGLDPTSGHGSPLSPNFLSVPQLQEVGKERRPAPMVV